MTTPQFHRRDVFTAGGSTIKGVNRVDWPEPLVNLAERKVEGGVGLSIINSIDPGTVVITTEGPVPQLEEKNGQDITLTLTRSFVKTTDSGVQDAEQGGIQTYSGKGIVRVPNAEGADVTDSLEAREYGYEVRLHTSARTVSGDAGAAWDINIPARTYTLGAKSNVLGLSLA